MVKTLLPPRNFKFVDLVAAAGVAAAGIHVLAGIQLDHLPQPHTAEHPPVEPGRFEVFEDGEHDVDDCPLAPEAIILLLTAEAATSGRAGIPSTVPVGPESASRLVTTSPEGIIVTEQPAGPSPTVGAGVAPIGTVPRTVEGFPAPLNIAAH